LISQDLKHGDDPESALRDARLRFVALFPIQYTESEGALDRVLSGAGPQEREALIRTFHRMAGLAGIVGFPSVSARAKELEELLLLPSTESLDPRGVHRTFASLREAFRADMDAPTTAWIAEPATAQQRIRIVVVEDDPDQRRLIVTRLHNAGHQVFEVDRGDMALGVIRAERPAVVLLDIDLPGASGLDVCRALKADPDLHDTPVVFLTGRSSPADRLAGLTVGGDDYLPKPADAAELRLRIDRVVARRAAAPIPRAGVLGYGQFLRAAVSVLDTTRAALALIRIPHEDTAAEAAAVEGEMRRGDLIGEYDQTHLLALRPDVTAHVAAQQLSTVADALAAARGLTVRMGVSGAERGGEFRVLLQQADEALAEARVRRVPVVAFGETPAETAPRAAAPVILIAEDDPDVMRVLDSRLQAAGYRTVLAFDGQQALEAITANAPGMVVLDLMLPRLTGFEVLTALQRSGGRRPKIVVVSARGREDDVTRAFQLGADDYMTKPFGPDELLARLARLLR
jgi:DNA-binding response OmpR family regulator/HPt (histidine-containing phosphotransfer) domain-containing protein